MIFENEIQINKSKQKYTHLLNTMTSSIIIIAKEKLRYCNGIDKNNNRCY